MPFVQSAHYGFSGVTTKIESGMLFVETDTSLQARVISPTKGERVGLYDAKIGDTVNMLVDSDNVLMDISRTDQFFPEHHFVAGRLHYADPLRGAIQLSTPEGRQVLTWIHWQGANSPRCRTAPPSPLS